MNAVQVKAEKRTDVGGKSSKAIRREGKIPCVIYGGGKNEYFTVTPNEVKEVIYTPDFKVVEIDVDGDVSKCIVKDLQMHPVTDEILHIDFLRLIDNAKIKVNLPIAFKGVSPGVKGGGRLIQTMRTIKVKAYPRDLTDVLYVSIEGLKLGDTVRVKDVELTEGLEVLDQLAQPVAKVAVPRALKSVTPAGEDDDEDEDEDGEGEEGGTGDSAES
ncbi:50S ribosomal protein L25 [Portibacter marinus]|uniref:50S ribosomal protein L25 n=1 Tax=Portibacter marinus TaxID=2898660 RepID=UPI001F229AAA|nr:50S ribosomal protein L25 [Portibacter marinus]